METSLRETWAKRIEQWKRSGLSAEDFAAQEGLSCHTLRNWRYKLLREARKGLE